MANQRKKGVKQLTHFDWETNVEQLRKIAENNNMTLSELLRERTKKLIEEYGGEHRRYDEE
jgi:hypothetical protein